MKEFQKYLKIIQEGSRSDSIKKLRENENSNMNNIMDFEKFKSKVEDLLNKKTKQPFFSKIKPGDEDYSSISFNTIEFFKDDNGEIKFKSLSFKNEKELVLNQENFNMYLKDGQWNKKY